MVKPIASFFTAITGVLGYVGGGWYPTSARDGVPPFRSVNSESGVTVSAGTALQLAAVWACVRLIAETIGTMPLELKLPDGNGKLVRATGSSIYRMLRLTPNRDMTAVEFWEMMVASVCLWGNAYAVKQKIAGRIVALDPLRPEFVTVFRNAQGLIRYAYLRGTVRVEYAAEDILHIKGFGVDGLVGLSPIAMARQTIGRASATDQASGKIFQSGLAAGGFIKYNKAFATPEQREDVRKTIEGFTGSPNTGKTMVLENGMEYEAITMHPNDAQMLESRQFNVEEIARWFRVPPQLIGHTTKSSSWASSVEQTTLGFVKFGLVPYLVRFEQGITRALALPTGAVLKFNFDALLRGDSAARAALWAAAGQNGIRTRAEMREDEGWPFIEGSDELTVQSNLVPLSKLGELGGQPTPPAVPPAKDPPPTPPEDVVS
jgi:HK97 family phage portal protein